MSAELVRLWLGRPAPLAAGMLVPCSLPGAGPLGGWSGALCRHLLPAEEELAVLEVLETHGQARPARIDPLLSSAASPSEPHTPALAYAKVLNFKHWKEKNSQPLINMDLRNGSGESLILTSRLKNGRDKLLCSSEAFCSIVLLVSHVRASPCQTSFSSVCVHAWRSFFTS